MARRTEHADRTAPGRPRSGEARRLIAGLRVTRQDEALLAVVRPFLADASSEGELAYRLWRRGLEVTLAEVASLGVPLPPGSSEELIAGLVAQRLLLCAPLLRRTGRLALLGLSEPTSPEVAPLLSQPSPDTAIDGNASAVIAGLGGSEFL
jgi:hypothetical protein